MPVKDSGPISGVGGDRGILARSSNRTRTPGFANHPGSVHGQSSCAPHARPRRHRRRRRHRHLHRLSPGRDGLERHRAARAAPADRRHHLARGRAHGHVRLDFGDVDRDPQVHARSLRASRGGDGTGNGIHADRLHRGCLRRGSPRGIPAGGGVQPLLRHRRAGNLAARGPAAVSARQGRRRASRLLRQGRRPREPGRRHDGTRQRRANAWREDFRRRARNRRAAEKRPRHRRKHPLRRHQDGLRRQLRWPVGARVRCAVGRRDLEPGRRALLPDHRGDQGPAAEHASARRPVQLRLLPAGGRWPDGRPVRTRVRALEDRGFAHRHALPRPGARLGTHGAVPRDGHGARAHHLAGRHEEILLRTGKLHARPEADRGRGARAARLLRRSRPQLDRHSHGRRARSRDGALDHQWPARRRRDRHEHRPRAALPGQPGLPPRTHGRVARHGLQVPLPDAHAQERARCAQVAVPRSPRGARRVFHRDERLGESGVVRRCRQDARPGARHLGAAKLVVAVGGRAPGRTRERDRHGHVVHGQIHGAGPRCGPLPQPHLRERRRRRGGHDHVHPVAQHGRQAGSGPHRDQARR